MAVRVGFAGTNCVGGAGAGAARRGARARDRARAHPARPAGRPRAQAGAAAGRRARRARSGFRSRSPSGPRDALAAAASAPGSSAMAVVAYGELVPRSLLDALPLVNLHPSALPRWRGAAPIERALMAGESDERRRRDAARRGARRRARSRRWSASTSGPTTMPGAVYERALELGARAARRARSRDAAARTARDRPAGRRGRPTPPRSTAADRVLDPRGPARELHDRVRALVAAHRRAARPRRRAAHDLAHARARRRPGRRARSSATATPSCSAAATGRSSCCELQPPGGRRMPAADWLRGLRGALPAATRRVSDAAHARAARGHARRSTRAPTPTARSPARPSGRRLDARERALAMHLAFGAVQRRRTLDAALEEIAERARCSGSSGALAHVLRLGVVPDPVRRRHPAACGGLRERGARAARDRRRARPGSRTPSCGASPARARAGSPRCPRTTPEEAALRHSLPDWIAELWFDAYGARAGARAVRGRQRAACAVALAEPAARRRGRGRGLAARRPA